MISKLKKIDYRHYIAVGIIVLIIVYTLLFRIDIYGRTWRSLSYFGQNFINIFKPKDSISLIRPPNTNLDGYTLPFSFKGMLYDFKIIALTLFNKDVFLLYLSKVITFLVRIMRIVIYVPIIYIITLLIKIIVLKEGEEEDDQESKALRAYKRLETKYIYPLKGWIREFKEFLRTNYVYRIIYWLLILTIFRITPIVIDIAGAYLGLFKTLNIQVVFFLLISIVIDILIILLTYNKVVLLIIGLWLVNKRRHYYGRKKLLRMQESNEVLAESIAIGTLITGPPGSGKTLMMTSMGLDIEMQFRFMAFDIIKKYGQMFPYFPWLNFETWLTNEVRKESLVNRSQIKKAISEIVDNAVAKRDSNFLFGYDMHKYPLVYFDGIKYVNIKQALIEYGQAYYLYAADKALSFSNYAIKHQYNRNGYFPYYDYDYINMDKKDLTFNAKYSSIMDFDSRRILNRMDPGDSSSWFHMDGQVEILTEIDKERGNKNDHSGLNKSSDDANQKNDGYNRSVKVTRHEYTIDNTPFTKILFDTQREQSVNADLRETCEDRIQIQTTQKETEIALPFVWVDYLICVPLTNKYNDYHYEFRKYRNDKTLYNYLLTKLFNPLFKHFNRITNLYGYKIAIITHEKGTTNERKGETVNKVYYFINQKMFSDRYSTDAYSDFFDNERLRAKEGFMQAKTYENTKATVMELKSQKSYWISELEEATNSVLNDSSKIEYKED